jgi:general secretion pathway protein B
MIVSFILDALRKLEEKQVPETTRELLGKEGSPARRHRGRRLWARTAAAMLLGGACLLAALVLLRGESGREDGELLSREDPGVSSPVANSAAVKPETSVPETMASETTAPPAEDIPAPGTAAPALPAEPEATPEGPSFPGSDDAPAAKIFDAGIAEAPHPGPDGRVVPIEDLPEEIRGALQDLRITGHIYSDDRSFRRLNVNDSMKKEGDMLPEGVRIDEVTQRGAVFSYRGYRFFMDVY